MHTVTILPTLDHQSIVVRLLPAEHWTFALLIIFEYPRVDCTPCIPLNVVRAAGDDQSISAVHRLLQSVVRGDYR